MTMGSGKRKKKKLARQRNNAGGKYVPPVVATADNKKVPASATQDVSYKNELVRWTAREIDEVPGAGDGRRWHLSANETVELLRFLDDLTKKTWAQCESEMANGRRRNHDHAITELTKTAQERLRHLDQNEERVFRFRLSGTCRLWGFRSGSLFRVLWYDPEHKVYPVKKHHT